MSLQSIKNRTVIAIIAAVAVIAIAIGAYALGITLGADNAYAGDNTSESAECKSCCSEEKSGQKDADCCANAEEAHKEAGHVKEN